MRRCPPDTACGDGCLCADSVGGGGACYQDANWCNSPEACNSDADCDNDLFICATNDALATCVPTGSAGLCVLPCIFPATTTTTTTAAPTTTTPAPATTTTAAPTTTTTTTAGPTTTTTTTAGPTTTTTTTTPPPGVTVDPVRGTVGSSFDLTIVGFPPNEEATILFIGSTGVNVDLGTVTTGANGGATTTRTVPTVPGGPKEIRVFTTGPDEVETTPFEVAPRLRVTPSTVQRGQSVAATVTGFAPNETVSIRWRVGDWGPEDHVGTLTTGPNGSGTVNVTVPANAAEGANKVRADGTAFAAQTNAVTVEIPPPPPSPSVSIKPTRGTVNTRVAYTVANFPAYASGTITWRRTSGSVIKGEDFPHTFETDETGAAEGAFRVPATPGGAGQVVTFAAGGVAETATYEVAPRIKVGAGAVGDTVDVSLRGFGRQEQGIRIRWRVNNTWVRVGTADASNTGSANVAVTIPAGAAAGANKVRGDGPQFRAQTNAAMVTAS